MTKKPYNKQFSQKRKKSHRRIRRVRKLLPKRISGVIGVSVLLENRDTRSIEPGIKKKETHE